MCKARGKIYLYLPQQRQCWKFQAAAFEMIGRLAAYLSSTVLNTVYGVDTVGKWWVETDAESHHISYLYFESHLSNFERVVIISKCA
jgi:hypothetical protein